MMRRLTERERERVWELRAEGHSSRAIGRELGLRPLPSCRVSRVAARSERDG